MGVYIKGFDFPKACWFCDFCRAYNEPNHGYFCCALDADLDKTTEIIQTQRDKHCPLVEVKPHGDLIDRDALMKDGWLSLWKRVDYMGGYAIHDLPLINPSIPVVLESEGDDEQKRIL